VLAGLAGVALAFVLPPRLSAVLFGVLMLVVAGELTHRALRARRGGPSDPGSSDAGSSDAGS